MTLFRRLGNWVKGLSPAAIREIIIILVILCISAALSIPEYKEDKEKAKLQKEMQKEAQEEMQEESFRDSE